MAKYWLGKVDKCDLCHAPIQKAFIDGKTKSGPWACMCPKCHHEHGVGLGTGRGQKYERSARNEWPKVEGQQYTSIVEM